MQNMILFARERETARELQELDDLREGFLAMIAHEVRSPLGAISTAAGVLRDQLDTMEPRDAKDIAAGIATGARHLSRLTGDLVDVGRGGQGRFPCLMKPVADFGVLVELTTRGVVGESTDRVTLEIESGMPERPFERVTLPTRD